jgi:hypothetical protein
MNISAIYNMVSEPVLGLGLFSPMWITDCTLSSPISSRRRVSLFSFHLIARSSVHLCYCGAVVAIFGAEVAAAIDPPVS